MVDVNELYDDNDRAYGHMGGLNRFQEEAVRYYVRHRWIHDLGAGLLGWAKQLIEFEATCVTAVDSIYKDRDNNVLNDRKPWPMCKPYNVLLDPRTFREVDEAILPTQKLQVAFVSWPCNTYGKTVGLERLVQRAEIVIYLGKNLDGTACGSPQFWDHVSKRKVLCFLPAVRNSLIVYGPEITEPRKPLLEEAAGLLTDGADNVIFSPPDYPRL